MWRVREVEDLPHRLQRAQHTGEEDLVYRCQKNSMQVANSLTRPGHFKVAEDSAKMR